jgi:hypothetical protein
MRILYIGTDSGTSGQRAAATRRLGHEVRLLDPGSLLPSGRLTAKWIWSTGALGVSEVVRRRMMEMLRDENFDVAWVDHGVLVGPGLVRDLKARIPTVLCYNVDDPFGPRDGMRWRTYLKAVPFYDLLVVVRVENVEEAFRAGAQRVMHVYRSADEVAHAPRRLPAVEFEQWRSEVVFVGTAFPERGPFFVELIRRGVPLTIYGERYNRLPEWRVLKPHWRPANTGSIEGYANAISAAKVCLGLLSKGNRDLHTQRSLEIPSLGAALCAERTSEHSALYEEDREAVFWTSAEECAAKCRALLGDDAWRQSIAARGRQRYLDGPWQNMRVIQAVLDVALNGGARLTTPASLESGRREMSRRTDLGETAIIPAGEIHAD